jgi:hypothetical protein
MIFVAGAPVQTSACDSTSPRTSSAARAASCFSSLARSSASAAERSRAPNATKGIEKK